MKLEWKQLALAIIATLWMAAGAAAEDYAAKSVRLLVGFSPGSATDIIVAAKQAAVREQLARQGGVLTPSPEDFAARIGAEMAQNADVIRRANIRID